MVVAVQQITVQKGRAKIVEVQLGYDVSGDTITSDIRVDKSRTSQLIATWTVAFATDGHDGELVLSLDDSVTSGITKSVGYMDLKRVTGSQSLSVFDEVLQVIFNDSVTA